MWHEAHLLSVGSLFVHAVEQIQYLGIMGTQMLVFKVKLKTIIESESFILTLFCSRDHCFLTWCCQVSIYYQETLHYLLYCYCSQSSSFPTENPDIEQCA